MCTLKRVIKKTVRYNPAFTIVELLVVIVVIGILATITIVSYTGISAKAIEASITTDLDNALKKFKMHQVENGGYPTTIDCSSATSATNICLKPSANNQYTLTTDNSVASNQYFCVSILNTVGNKRQYIASDGMAGTGVCPVFTLTIIAGTGGTATGGGTFTANSVQTVTATPNSGSLFSSWTGDVGCVGLSSHTITMDANKTCTANFIVNPWIDGIATTILAGKKIRNADLSGLYQYKTSNTAVTSPQGAVGLDPNYPSNMSLVNPQTNSSIDFSAYPAQDACKAIGGRLPNMQELTAIYTDRVSYGNNFQLGGYRSSTEYPSTDTYNVNFNGGNPGIFSKGGTSFVRCISG